MTSAKKTKYFLRKRRGSSDYGASKTTLLRKRDTICPSGLMQFYMISAKKTKVFFAEEERQLAKRVLTACGKNVKDKFASTSRSTQEAQGAPLLRE